MEELIQAISQKTGLPEAQARQAAETALAFIKQKLPAPLASQLDSLMAGSGGSASGDSGLMGQIGGLLGN